MVKGGQYQLIDKNNNVVEIFTLSDGTVEMTDIPRGFYTVKEIVSPEGYTVQTEEKEIVIDSGVTECVFLYVNENTRVVPASMSVKFTVPKINSIWAIIMQCV